MQSEPPHVSGLPVARIQWHRTRSEATGAIGIRKDTVSDFEADARNHSAFSAAGSAARNLSV